MTREEAKKELFTLLGYYINTSDITDISNPTTAIDMAIEALKERPHGECKTCKYYSPYREQFSFSYRYRGDGYCKSNITNSEGVTYINCNDNWYCANYEKKGEAE